MTTRTSKTHALYRFYSATGQLLYVGITNNPGVRFQQHQQGKQWWHEVSGISVERCPSREDALAAETRAIAVEHPLYNLSGPSLPSQKRAVSKQVPPAPRALVWICETCRKPIANKQGYLHINMATVSGHQQNWAEFEEDNSQDGAFSIGGKSWEDFLGLPNPVTAATGNCPEAVM